MVCANLSSSCNFHPTASRVSSEKMIFKGDGELMVDMLVSACAKENHEKPQLPGFGRELVPYFVPGTQGDLRDINTNLSKGKGKSKRNPQLAPAVPSISEGNNKKPETKTQQAVMNGDSSKGQAKNGANRNTKRERRNSPHSLSDLDVNDLPQHNAVSPETQRKVREAFQLAANARSSGKPSKPNPPAVAVVKAGTVNDVSPPATPPKVARWAGSASTQSPQPENIPMPSLLGFTPGASLVPPPSFAAPSNELMNILGVSPPSCGVETTKLLTPQDLLGRDLVETTHPQAASFPFNAASQQSSSDLGEAAQHLLMMLNVQPIAA
ncbi:hypothetical protein CYMTET_39968 [Cymbomonas tetramitiformis]|uniref:Uncharacterized protein n=1 Tax=Cymbomonas tetramitiformis TaxID=36881 RepID=A0AAE0C904_9CHLO|nr:hypothetical protein CYMTET_39968 [Cymbomonas tetramitiformis]